MTTLSVPATRGVRGDSDRTGPAADPRGVSGPAGLAVGVGDGGSTGGNLLGATGQLAWDGPVELGTGAVPGTITPTTTPEGGSAVRWTQTGAKANTWIEVTPSGTIQGQTYEASVTLQGAGHVYLNFYNGQSDVGSTAIALTGQPQVLSVLSTVPTGAIRPPKFQIRTDADTDLDVVVSGASLVQQKPGAGWLNAQFDMLSITPGVGALARSAYKLVNSGTGKVLNVAADGTVTQAADSDAGSQHWQLIGRGTGYPEVAAAGSGRVITAGSGRVAGSGSGLSTVRDISAQTQQWRFDPQPDGGYALTNRRSRLLVTAVGGARVTQRPADRRADQSWRLVPAATANATYSLVNRNSGLTTDVAGLSTSDGGKILQWSDTGGANQQWRLVTAGAGYWKLVNVNSGKLLEVPGSSTTPDTDVDQWSDTGGANQQWQLPPVAGGYYEVVRGNSELMLDVWQSRTDLGAGLQQRTGTGRASQ